MNAPSRNPLAGGCLLTASILIGVAVGAFQHQLSIGFLAGLGIGLVLVVLIWLIDRLRR